MNNIEIISDFQKSAIVYTVCSLMLLAFAITNTAIFFELRKYSNNYHGVNVLAMAIVSLVFTVFGTGFFIYGIYKLIQVYKKRDTDLKMITTPEQIPQAERPPVPLEEIPKVPVKQTQFDRPFRENSNVVSNL